MTIESPCIQHCSLDPARGLCIGCGRTAAEIGAWLSYSTEQRRVLMASLPGRLARADAQARDA